MRLKTWTVLIWLLLFVKGVSFADNCSEIRNITVFRGQSFTLDFDQDGVEDSVLIDDNGIDIARIETRGNITILDPKYNLTVVGFSYRINNGNTEGQRNFSVSVHYTNGRHCTQHYLVTVHGDQICSEIKGVHTFLGRHFTLDFDPHGVEKITWDHGMNKAIAVTKDKAILQIINADYEGNLSVSSLSLLKHDVTTKDAGDYTATVLFHNGSRCLQQYFVTVQNYQWTFFFMPCLTNLNMVTSVAFLIVILIIVAIFSTGLQKYKKNNKEQEQVDNSSRRNRKESECIYEMKALHNHD